MAEMVTLEQVIADARGEVPVLKRRGAGAVADAIEDLCNQVSRAAEPFMTWLSEQDAMLRSGRKVAYFRQRFPGWEAQGFARWDPRNRRARQYLLCIVPQRANLDAVRADARRAAREAAA